jgi:polyphosphate kinase
MNTEVWLKDELKSWLQFNDRVIHEASRKDINPIFERLNFLGIADDNLDEFIRTKFKFNKGLRSLIRSQTYAIEDLYETTVSEF